MTGVIVVVSGEDPILRADARVALVEEHVGTDDRSLVLTEFSGEDWEMAELVDAAQTPPFLTDRRIVVGRDVQRLKAKADMAVLLEYLEDPLSSTVLILEWGGGGAVPRPLVKAVEAAGGTKLGTGPGRKVGDYVTSTIASSDLRVDRAGVARLVDWVGEEANKLTGLVPLLVSTYGPGATIGVDDIEPFLGDAGGVPPWDLTDAIDRGDIRASLDALGRMSGAGRHPLQILAILQNHFTRIMRLDGAGARTDKDAAVLLGMKGSTYPAKKALNQARKLGHPGVAASVRLLADADLAVKGATGIPAQTCVELCVARLARTSAAAR